MSETSLAKMAKKVTLVGETITHWRVERREIGLCLRAFKSNVNKNQLLLE